MPRKPSPGPTILRIELMSTGHEYRAAPGLDDFTGQPIEPAADTRPINPLQSADDIIAQSQRAKRKALQELGVSIGITKDGFVPIDKPKAAPFKRRL